VWWALVIYIVCRFSQLFVVIIVMNMLQKTYLFVMSSVEVFVIFYLILRLIY